MYLIAEDAWEVTSPLMKASPEATGKAYSCFEVDLNAPLWHLDILVTTTNGMECWRRFVLTSLEQAVATAAEHPKRSKLHFQSACSFNADTGYVLWPVKKVLAGWDADGLPAHLLVFGHRNEIYPNRRLLGAKFTSTSCVYEALYFGAPSADEQSL